MIAEGKSRRGARTREVPGDDLTNDTDRFMESVRELILVGLDGLAVDLVRPTTVVSDSRDRRGNVGILGPLESLAYTHSASGYRQVPGGSRVSQLAGST